MNKIKVLNLYAGIGGNRKLWKNVDVTAVEIDENIADIYKKEFPEDEVIVTDAHQFLLEHFNEFDFIWSSPPCPTHSRMRHLKNFEEYKQVYPDMKLWQEIIFLKHWFKGNWVVENVISYYEPLLECYSSGNHYFWSNFFIPNLKKSKRGMVHISHKESVMFHQKEMNIDLSNLDKCQSFKEKILNNCVHPELGLHVFNSAYKSKQKLLSESHKSHTLASPTFPTEKAINMRYQETSEEVSQIAKATSDNANINRNNKVRLQR